MKNDTERGLVGAWARRSRMAAKLTVPQAVTRLAQAGTAADESYIRAIEGGSKKPRIDSEIVAALAAAYRASLPEAPTPEAPATPTSDTTALVTAMTRQTDAITGLLEELRAERAERTALAETVNELRRQLDDLGAKLLGGGGAPGAPPAPTQGETGAPPRGGKGTRSHTPALPR